jgi:hypothetical protein
MEMSMTGGNPSARWTCTCPCTTTSRTLRHVQQATRDSRNGYDNQRIAGFVPMYNRYNLSIGELAIVKYPSADFVFVFGDDFLRSIRLVQIGNDGRMVENRPVLKRFADVVRSDVGSLSVQPER